MANDIFGSELNVDFSGILHQADEFDKKLKDIDHTAKQLGVTLRNALGNLDLGGLKSLKEDIERLGESKISLKVVGAEELTKMSSALDTIISQVEIFSRGGVSVFDSKALHSDNNNVLELSASLEKVDQKISKLKEAWKSIGTSEQLAASDEAFKGFVPPTHKNGTEYKPESKTYQNAMREHLEAQARIAIEEKAILSESLNWAKKTEDEKAAYIQKKLNDIFKAEEQQAKRVRKEYSDTVNEMVSLMKQTDSLNKKNTDGSITPQIKQMEDRFTELNAKRVQLEQQYGEHVVDIAQKTNSKVLAIEANRILEKNKKEKEELEKWYSTPSGAMHKARMAEGVGEKEDAMGYLKTAMKGNYSSEVINELMNKYQELRIAVEEHKKALNGELSLQPTVRAEYMRLRKELDSVVESKEKLAKTQAYKSGDEVAKSDYNAMTAREEDIQAKIIQIRKNAQGQLDAVDREYESKRAQASVDVFTKAENQKTEIAKQRLRAQLAESSKYGNISVDSALRMVRVTDNASNVSQHEAAIRKLKDAINHLDESSFDYGATLDKLNQKIKAHEDAIRRASMTEAEYYKQIEANYQKEKDEYWKNQAKTSPNAILTYSKDADSINKQIKAIELLKIARDNLNKTAMGDTAYLAKVKELNEEIKRQQKEVDKLRGKQEQLKNSKKGLMDTMGQLQRKLALLFSVSAIQGYIGKLAKVRGEFELQQRSLNVLIGNRQQADKLWNQTVQLAVRSPFRVSELVTYTKQLAAYRIETSKLYETTKMLADVSAGLGVDMQRLILAYGQIKAAGFLRGTEVRQLTEAGVNVYEELAKHFSEMEKTDVTVAQVIQRISKRQVAFSDVEQIFKNITGEGGAFYQMQEQQADTLKGMLSNMRDTTDLMLNDIGKSNEGILKWFVSATKEIIENWRVLATVIKQVSVALGLLGLKSFVTGFKAVAAAGAEAAAGMTGMAAAGAKLKISLNAIGAAIKSNPITAIVAALGSLAWATYDYYKTVSESNKVYDENARVLASQMHHLNNIKNSIEENNNAIKTYNELSRNRFTTEAELAESQEKANTALASNSKILAELKEKHPQVYEGLKKQKDGTIDLNNSIEAQNTLLRANLLLQRRAKGDWFTDDLTTNAGEAQEKLVEYQNAIKDINIAAQEGQIELEEMLKSGKITKADYDAVSEYLSKLSEIKDNKGLNDVQGEFYKNYANTSAFQVGWNFVSDAINDAANALGTYQTSLNNLKGNLENQKSVWRNTLTEMLSADPEKGAENARDYIKQQLTEFQIYDEEIKKWAFTTIVKMVGVKLSYESGNKTTDNADEFRMEWQKKIWDIIQRIKAQNPNISIPITAQDLITGNKEEILAKVRKFAEEVMTNAQVVIKGYEVKGQKVYSKEEKDNKQKENELGKELFAAAGGFGKSSRSRGGSSRKQEDPAKEFANVLKDIRDAYEDLNDWMFKNDAVDAVTKDWQKTFEEAAGHVKNFKLSFKDFDFTTVEGLVSALEKLKGAAKLDKTKLEIKQLISQVSIAEKKEDAKTAADERDREIDQLFEMYELYKEIEKLGVSKDFAKSLFGIKATSLDEIQKEIDLMYSKGRFAGQEGHADYIKYRDKIDEEYAKNQQERLKTYLEYARDAVGERAKIKLEELKKLSEIEQAFKPLETDTPEVKEQKEKAKEIATQKVKDDSAQATKKLEWEEFQKSDTFMSLFEDLDNASTALMGHTLNKIRDFKNEWADMPLEDVKAMTDKINQLENAIELAKNPFTAVKNIRKKVEEETGQKLKSPEELDTEGAALDAENERLNKEIASLEVIRSLKSENKALDDDQKKILENLNISTGATTDELDKQITTRKDALDQNNQAIQDVNKQKRANKDITKAYNSQAEALKNIDKMANDLYDAFSEIWEVVGNDEMAKVWADMGMSIASSVFQATALIMQLTGAKTAAEAFGVAMNSAMGIVGLIVMAVQIVAQVLSAAFKAHDEGKQKEIDEEVKSIERLEKELEKLEERLETVYSLGGVNKSMRQVQANIDDQIQSYEKMMRLEEEKKSTDEDQIEEWKENIEELREKRKELHKEMVESLGGDYDIRSVARDFVDAWIDAFKETGDGLKGLRDNFKDFFLNILLEQAVMQKVGSFFGGAMNYLNDVVLSDYLVTDAERKKTEGMFDEAMIKTNDYLNLLFGENGVLNKYIDDTDSSLSGLQQGIQGVTEETAQIIEAYLNSIRFYIAQDNQNLAKLVDTFTNVESPNPILSELRTQTELITSIRDLFRDVVRMGHPTYGGAFLKVAL
jgi:hypothetical protein